jgi:hypothetical protein
MFNVYGQGGIIRRGQQTLTGDRIASSCARNRSLPLSGAAEWVCAALCHHAAAPTRSLETTPTSNPFPSRWRAAIIDLPDEADAKSTERLLRKESLNGLQTKGKDTELRLVLDNHIDELTRDFICPSRESVN